MADAGFRTYGLTENRDARSFSHADWYTCPVARRRMKELMRRRDGIGLRDYGLWLGLLVVSGVVAFFSWGTWWAVPAFLVYGVLYASAAESRFHECIHGTPFKSRWINEGFFHLLGFMSLKNSVLWRWSHTRHHTDTIVVGRDPEIAYPRPADVWGMVLNVLHLRAGPKELAKIGRHAIGRLNADERDYVPVDERRRVVWVARAYAAAILAVVIWAIVAASWLPLMFVVLPTFYGSWLHHSLSAMQHAGLAEDVPDHRLNSRTVYLNPVLSFIYANMNYHLEHHMFPMVPFHALPAMHEEIKADCPPAYRGMRAAYREMVPAIRAQLRDPGYYVPRALPAAAA